MQATLTGHPSRAVIGRGTIIVIPAIFPHLGHIACGVEKAETTGLERPGRSRSLRLAGIALPAVRLTGAHGASPPVRSIRSGAGGVFPFRFGRKPIGLAGLLRQPSPEHLGVQPTKIDRRTVATAPTAIIGPILASAVIDAFVPFAECHFVPSDGEGLRKSHAVDWMLVFRCVTHVERTRRQHHTLGTVGAIAKCIAGLEPPRAGFGRRRSRSGLRRGLDDRWRHGGRRGSGGGGRTKPRGGRRRGGGGRGGGGGGAGGRGGRPPPP